MTPASMTRKERKREEAFHAFLADLEVEHGTRVKDKITGRRFVYDRVGGWLEMSSERRLPRQS